MTDEPRDNLPIARAASVPLARPAVVAVPAGYPVVPMSRWKAAVDLAIVICLLLGGEIGIASSGLGGFVVKRWSSLGLFAVNIPLGLLCLLGIGTILLARRQSVGTIGLNRAGGLRVFVATIIATPAAYAAALTSFALYLAVSRQTPGALLEQRTDFLASIPTISIGTLVPFTLFVGLHEEITFRGFLLSRLRALLGSTPAAIVLTSIVFALPHIYQGWVGVFQIGAVGLVLGIVAAYARTLWPAILTHAMFDMVNLVLAPIVVRALKEMGLSPAVVLGWGF